MSTSDYTATLSNLELLTALLLGEHILHRELLLSRRSRDVRNARLGFLDRLSVGRGHLSQKGLLSRVVEAVEEELGRQCCRELGPLLGLWLLLGQQGGPICRLIIWKDIRGGHSLVLEKELRLLAGEALLVWGRLVFDEGALLSNSALLSDSTPFSCPICLPHCELLLEGMLFFELAHHQPKVLQSETILQTTLLNHLLSG